MLETMITINPSKEVTVKLNIAQEIHFAEGVVVKMKPVLNGDGFHGTKISIIIPERWRGHQKFYRIDDILWGVDEDYGIRNDKLEYRRKFKRVFTHRKCNSRQVFQIQLHVENGRNYGTLEFHHVESLI